MTPRHLRSLLGTTLAGLVVLSARSAGGADATPAAPNAPAAPDAQELDAAEADKNRQQKSSRSTWNALDGPVFTMRLGGGFLVDAAGYAQDEASKRQMTLEAKPVLRDLRLLLSGKIKAVPGLTYSVGYMYDAAIDDWRFRQTGLMLEIPQLAGRVFFGRTKEGFSTNKLMVGYNGWTMERAAVNDAFLPILADGLRWTGSALGGAIVYNLGWFFDTRSQNEPFNKSDRQFAARIVGLPLANRSKAVLHIATEGRYAAADDGFLQFRSKPESFGAKSYAVDSGKLPATGNIINGFEVYYRPGSLMFGMEYFLNRVYSKDSGDPLFHGGEIFAAYLLTGEVRPYNARGAFFEGVSPARSVFNGGPGAVEVVLRYSYVDLDSRRVSGGTFWRLTPMVSWYWSDNVRLELAYGFSSLDRLEQTGTTHYFQSRLQLSLN